MLREIKSQGWGNYKVIYILFQGTKEEEEEEFDLMFLRWKKLMIIYPLMGFDYETSYMKITC